jgi:hypothetical protein
MEPIELQALETVRGGFGAILGALLQAAPGILQGVSGIISASKSGGSSATQATSAQPQTQPTAAGPLPAAGGGGPPTQMASAPAAGACQCACNLIAPASVQNSVRIA